MNVFEPLRTYSSPLRTAVVLIRATSEPASGSVSPKEQRIGSLDQRRQPRAASARRCRRRSPARRRDRCTPSAVPIPEQPQFSSSPTSAPSSRPSSGPPYSRRHVQVHQAELVRLRDHVGRVGHVLVVLGRPRPDLLLREVVRELAQRALLLGERERHALGDGVLGVAIEPSPCCSSLRSIDWSVNSTKGRCRVQA